MEKYRVLTSWLSGLLCNLFFIGCSIYVSDKDNLWLECSQKYGNIGRFVIPSCIIIVVASIVCFTAKKFKYANVVSAACFFIVAILMMLAGFAAGFMLGIIFNISLTGTLFIANIIPFIKQRLDTVQ